MSRAFNRLREQVNDLEEQLMQIKGALALVEIEGLADAIDSSEKGQQLRRALINIEKITNPRRNR